MARKVGNNIFFLIAFCNIKTTIDIATLKAFLFELYALWFSKTFFLVVEKVSDKNNLEGLPYSPLSACLLLSY